jgi:hypothetical protein
MPKVPRVLSELVLLEARYNETPDPLVTTTLPVP